MIPVSFFPQGLTTAAKLFLGGCREGCVTLFKPNHYPRGAIGPVSFLWQRRGHIQDTEEDVTVFKAKKPKLDSTSLEPHTSAKSSEETEPHLWIWVHPACFQEAFDSIVEACKLVGSTTVLRDETQTELSTSCNSESREGVVLGTEMHVTGAGQTEEHTNLEPRLTVASRRFELLRFRLTGPESHALLAATLRLAGCPVPDKSGMEPKEKNSNISQLQCAAGDNAGSMKRKGVQTEAVGGVQVGNSRKQVELWATLQQVSSPSVCPQSCVIGLTVLDPRLDLPGKRTSVHAAVDNISCSGETCHQYVA